MKYLELTRPDDSTILINRNSISSVYSYNDYTVVMYSGSNKQQVKETYDQIKSMLLKEEKNECGCK